MVSSLPPKFLDLYCLCHRTSVRSCAESSILFVLWSIFLSSSLVHCKNASEYRGYCEMCRKYKIKFWDSTCSSQIISLTKQKQNLNNFKIKVYYSAELLCQGTHNVVVVFANVVVVVVAFADMVVVVVLVFAFGVRRSRNVFARPRGASQVLVE